MKTTKRICRLLFLITFLAGILAGCDIFGDRDDDKPMYAAGDTLWVHESSGSPLYIKATLALDLSGNIIYAEGGTTVTWQPCRIACINKADGSLKWVSENLDNINISSEIVVGDDGVIYVIGYYTLYAVDPATGQFLWTWEVPETLPHPDVAGGTAYTKGQIGALALTRQGNLVLGSIGSGVYWRGLYAIDKSGRTLWYNLKAFGWQVMSGIYIGPDGNLYFYGNADQGELVSVNASTGVVRWRKNVWGVSSYSNNILIQSDGSLICSVKSAADAPYKLHRVDPANGNITWSSTAESNFYTKWMGPDGAVYQSFPFDNGIQKFDMQTGSRQPFFSGQSVSSSWVSAINQSNQLAIIHATGDRLARISILNLDGTEDWFVRMTGLDKTVMLISDDKVMYGIINEHPVSYLPGKIYAIQGSAALASAGWPRPSHDNRNTFNISKH